MSCDVSLGGYDGDQSEFWVESSPKARKAHKCCECRESIQPGERYQRVVGKWDGRLETYRFCVPCWEISGEFSEDGRVFGAVWDEFEQNWHAGANLQACLNRVSTVAAKMKLREQWQKWKGVA
jgi:hypothetical protein